MSKFFAIILGGLLLVTELFVPANASEQGKIVREGQHYLADYQIMPAVSEYASVVDSSRDLLMPDPAVFSNQIVQSAENEYAEGEVLVKLKKHARTLDEKALKKSLKVKKLKKLKTDK